MKKNLYIHPEIQVTEITGMRFICGQSNRRIGNGGGTSGIGGGGPIIGS